MIGQLQEDITEEKSLSKSDLPLDDKNNELQTDDKPFSRNIEQDEVKETMYEFIIFGFTCVFYANGFYKLTSKLISLSLGYYLSYFLSTASSADLATSTVLPEHSTIISM